MTQIAGLRPKSTGTPPPARITPGVRPEIQAIRAGAVALVVGYHFAPDQVPGGYVGVDVFFVLSGFLITSHIYRELSATGTFRFRRFYARRISRLLPASLLVLLFTAIATVAWVPATLWAGIGKQLVASTLYVQNWVLAADATEYSASSPLSSPVQHFWSLSAEEQFYALWPLLLVAAAAVSRARRWPLHSIVTGVLVGVVVVSFALSVLLTAQNPDAAYFVTPTRAWEFAAGGLLAVLRPRPIGGSGPAAASLRWLGAAVVVVSAFGFSAATPFPGWLALVPVLGTLAVIAAGDVSGRYAAAWLVNSRVVQYVGDISYSLYLWHWPLLILVPFMLSAPVTPAMRVGMLVATVVLAAVTKSVVEDRFRGGTLRVRAGRGARSVSTVRVVAVAMAGVCVLGGATAASGLARVDDARAQMSRMEAVRQVPFGAETVRPHPQVVDQVDPIMPPALIAHEDFVNSSPDQPVCQERGAFTGIVSCRFDTNAVHPTSLRVALVGDSHAAQWLPAVLAAGEAGGWTVDTYLRSGCPLTAASFDGRFHNDRACDKWNDAVSTALVAEPYDVVVVSSYRATTYHDRGEAVEGLAQTWRTLESAGSQVLVVADSPTPVAAGISDPPTCVTENAGSLGDCALERSSALTADPMLLAATQVGHVDVLDLTEFFCDDSTCPAVIDGVLVYRDANHLTGTFARSFGGMVSEAVHASID